jgi:hypothetical protein
MAHTFPLLNLIVALRAKTKTAFALPDGTKIPVSGDPLVVVSPESLPMSVISFPDGGESYTGGRLRMEIVIEDV